MTTIPTEALLLVFAAFWFGGAATLSRLAGWHTISALYPAPTRLAAEEFRSCSVRIGRPAFPIHYRRCVRVLLPADGLGLCLMLPFRFHSPPFVVPWTQVASCTEQQTMATRKVTFGLAGTDRVLTFDGPLGQELKVRYETARAGG